MENKKESFDYEALKKKTLEQFRSGKSLFGKDGAFAPLLQDFLESALQSEMDEHLTDEERFKGNRRNGLSRKTFFALVGVITITVRKTLNWLDILIFQVV